MIKHGDHKTRLYHIWLNMKYRCNNPNSKDYKNYGAKGIKVLWNSYESFKRDMGEPYNKSLLKNNKISLDRIDTDGHYCKENCRWTDSMTQMNNRNYNVNITFNKQTKTISQWSRELGIKGTTIYQRVRRGVTEPSLILAKSLR
jgi:hypothetical protein